MDFDNGWYGSYGWPVINIWSSDDSGWWKSYIICIWRTCANKAGVKIILLIQALLNQWLFELVMCRKIFRKIFMENFRKFRKNFPLNFLENFPQFFSWIIGVSTSRTALFFNYFIQLTVFLFYVLCTSAYKSNMLWLVGTSSSTVYCRGATLILQRLLGFVHVITV